MPNLKDIRTRIESVKNTRKITSAMKMVAAAKLRKAQERMEASRPYAYRMQRLIDGIAGRIDEEAHPLLERRDNPHKTLVVIISSNRGLCGGFNSNLFRGLDRFLDEQRIAGEIQELATVGRKANAHYKKSNYEVVANYPDVIDNVSYKKAKRISQDIIDQFIDGSYDSVYLCFNRFISAIANEWIVGRLLPLSMAVELTEEDAERPPEEAEAKAEQKEAEDIDGEYIYEPELDTLLDKLLPSHVKAQVMQALVESEATEQAARMTAMDSATNNASDMIEDLTLQYNRARQAYITKEIVEIVSGAESLKG